MKPHPAINQTLNGHAVTGSGALQTVLNPATEEPICVFRACSASEAEDALVAARSAFPAWAETSLEAREAVIRDYARLIEEERETLMELLMAETGKNLAAAEYEVMMLGKCLTFFIEAAKQQDGQILNDYNNKHLHMVVRRPVGVVVCHLAWNFPLLNLAHKLGPVLASGCTCVIRPSSATPLATLYACELATRVGFPDGVVNGISGPASEIAEVLNASPIPDMITIIGSSSTGMDVVRQSATSVKHYSLELGGDAPVVVLKDADVEQAALTVAGLKFGNCGQICVSPNRIFVHESVKDAFLGSAVAYASKLKLGWGREPDSDMGPLISAKARERMLELIEDAREKGAQVLCGGRIPENKEKGFFMEPTILSDVSSEMRVCQEEIFGPIMPVMSFKDTNLAVEAANDTPYGLAAYLFTTDLNEGLRVSAQLEAGTVCVNTVSFGENLPHGGIKQSGVGKDCSVYSLEEYTHLKRISIAR